MNKILVGMIAAFTWTVPATALQEQQPQKTSQSATITGTIKDAATGAGLMLAGVTVEGTKLGATSASDGKYRIERVPPGRVTLKVMRIGYSPVVRSGIEVTATGPNVVDVALTQQALAGVYRNSCL